MRSWQPIRRCRYRDALLITAILMLLLPLQHAGASGPDALSSPGGPTMPSTTTYAIYWLPAGQTYEPAGTDSGFETLTQRFLSDIGGTNFYNIVTQYPDGADHSPANSSVLGGAIVDTTPYPQSGSTGAPLGDSDIQAEVGRTMSVHGWSGGLSTLFLVYTGYNVHDCLDSPGGQCSSDTFCAYHSWFVPSGSTQPVIYAVLPDPASDTGSCLASGSGNGSYPNGDAVADSATSLTAKELFGAVTDPEGNGWADSTGAEIGDKCDWDFGTVAADGGNVTLNHGDRYLVQREWSNDAGGCSLSYAPPPRTTRRTPTPSPAGTATSTPNPIPGQATRVTPTPAAGGSATATPTAPPGRSHRLSPFS